MIDASLASIDETYRGTHRYFNDDVIGRLLDWAVKALGDNVLEPFVNGVMRGDPVCLALAAALAIVAAGFLLRLGANLADAMTRSSR